MADRGSAFALRGGRGGRRDHCGLLAINMDVISELTEITYCLLYHLHLGTLDEYSIARFAVEVFLPLNTPIVLSLFLRQLYSDPFANLEVCASTKFNGPSACDCLDKCADWEVRHVKVVEIIEDSVS